MVGIRDSLCRELNVEEDRFPFAGELIQVREEEAAWEGAIERVLHNYALSLLVPDEDYARVAQWVERTHLGRRLVYYRESPRQRPRPSHPNAKSLRLKLPIRPPSPFTPRLTPTLPR